MKKYKQIHVTAKIIVCIIVTMLITLAQLATMPLSLLLNALAVIVWMFGVNPLGHLIESLKGHKKHDHDIF